MSDEIGNPFDTAAQTGVIGRRPATKGYQDQAAAKTTVSESKGADRVKRTLMFIPDRARWLKIQAAVEGREMSDIVEEALATYEQLHPRTEK